MKFRLFRLAVLLAAVSLGIVSGFGKSLEELAETAVSEDAPAAAEAVRELRGRGRDGLDSLVRAYADEIERFARTGAADERFSRIARALDAVAMQKDAYAARLFWHTDLDAAKAEAARTGRPILSLRLLGNLNEEFSCANSRFFRALLYSNSEISALLREKYVLHWKSVRPAPRVTIDFGDGRRIERTITGNSIHYILDEQGAIIDALPGLYAPHEFLSYLTKAAEVRRTTNGAAEDDRNAAVGKYRRAQFADIVSRRDRAVQDAGVTLVAPAESTSALGVAPRAITKMATERPILGQISDDFARFEPQIELGQWQKLADRYAAPRFDAASVAFIKRQNAKTGLSAAQFDALLANLKKLVALDTTRNEFLFHTKLYEWLNATPGATRDLEAFNARVYDELFKTPAADRWLGLYTADVYTALDGNGLVRQ